MKKFNFDDYTVEINDSEKIRNAVFNAVLNWMKKNEYWHGECIQCDDFMIEGPHLLSDIIDNILKPEVKYDEDI